MGGANYLLLALFSIGSTYNSTQMIFDQKTVQLFLKNTRGTTLSDRYTETIRQLGVSLNCASMDEYEILTAATDSMSLPKNKLSADVIRAVLLSLLTSNPPYAPDKALKMVTDHRQELHDLVNALLEEKTHHRWLMIPILAIALPIFVVSIYQIIATHQQPMPSQPFATPESVATVNKRVDAVEQQLSTDAKKLSQTTEIVEKMDQQLAEKFNAIPQPQSIAKTVADTFRSFLHILTVDPDAPTRGRSQTAAFVASAPTPPWTACNSVNRQEPAMAPSARAGNV